jgi:hypothetical protein
MASQRIQFTEDVIQKKERVDATALLDQFVAGEAKGEGQRALLALGRLTASVPTLE